MITTAGSYRGSAIGHCEPKGIGTHFDCARRGTARRRQDGKDNGASCAGLTFHLALDDEGYLEHENVSLSCCA